MRLSYSTIDMYKQCQRWFWLAKIAKIKVPQDRKYMDAGNTVHECLEYFYTNKIFHDQLFYDTWNGYDLRDRLSASDYLTMVKRGIQLKLPVTALEQKFEFSYPHFVGYMDVVDKNSNTITDWKTSTWRSKTQYEEQAKYYSWAYHKKYDIIPTANFVFLKSDRINTFKFTHHQLKEVEEEIININNYIEKYKDNKIYFPKCKKCAFFCPYKKHCNEITVDTAPADMKLKIVIRGHDCYIVGNVHPMLSRILDGELSYDLKNKFWIEKNRGKGSGTIHLYNKYKKCFSLGHIEKVKTLIKQYTHYKNLNLVLDIEDMRDAQDFSNLANPKPSVFVNKLHTHLILRPYQEKAVETAIQNKLGFLELATGSGKTLITAELINRLNTKTLWIVDRKELLYQTKEQFEEWFGCEWGIIGDGETSIKKFTVATIQTLNSYLKRKDGPIYEYLKSIKVAIVDEGHHAAARSYQQLFRHMSNTHYRIATTGTAKRDDGDQEMMFSIIGPVLMSVTAKELADEGYLMKPTIKFMKVKKSNEDNFIGEYQETYNKFIVENYDRNLLIRKLVAQNINKKTLILTKIVDHGVHLASKIPGSRFIHGGCSKINRTNWLKMFKNGKVKVLIGTMSIFAEGIDVPDLDIIINAGANSSVVKSVQILGRVLRKSDNKDSATYIDFMDNHKLLKSASWKRIKALKKEGHDVEIEK